MRSEGTPDADAAAAMARAAAAAAAAKGGAATPVERRTSVMAPSAIATPQAASPNLSGVKANPLALEPGSNKTPEKTTDVAFQRLNLKGFIMRRVLAGAYRKTSWMFPTTTLIIKNYLEDKLETIRLLKKELQTSTGAQREAQLAQLNAALTDYERVRLSLSTIDTNGKMVDHAIFKAGTWVGDRNVMLNTPVKGNEPVLEALPSIQARLTLDRKVEELETRFKDKNTDRAVLLDQAFELESAYAALPNAPHNPALTSLKSALVHEVLNSGKTDGEYCTYLNKNLATGDMKTQADQQFIRTVSRQLVIIKHPEAFTPEKVTEAQNNLAMLRTHTSFVGRIKREAAALFRTA